MMGFETQGKHKYINKRKKKLIFSTIYVDGGTRDTTYGIRAGVETLGPNWAQNAPTGFTLELHGY